MVNLHLLVGVDIAYDVWFDLFPRVPTIGLGVATAHYYVILPQTADTPRL
jgi:hypothetical protein